MSDAQVLIVCEDAERFDELIAGESSVSIPAVACRSAEQAVDAYADHRVLFGDPSMIAAALPSMPSVEWVQSTWAGVNALLDIDRRDYVLTGVKDVFGPQMSSYVLGYLLAHELRIIERLGEQRAHRWTEAESGIPQGKTIGIMGTGSIGSDIGRAAKAMELRVIGLSRSGLLRDPFDDVLPIESIKEFLSGLDYLVSVLPSTPETDHLLNEETIACLPDHCLFINVGRANVVDDGALIAALKSGKLGGAVLDVFDEEPVAEDSPLWDTPNLLMTAHIAAISHPELLVPLFIENYKRFVRGESLNHVVDFELGY